MSYQFELTRNATIQFVEQLDEQTADAQAPFFNNTIRWHIGHVLVLAESLLFGYPDNSNELPTHYNDLFKTGTKPADWSGEVPELPELIEQLEAQKVRIDQLTDDFLARDLDYTLPFGNFKTYADVYELLMMHDNEHRVKIAAMTQVAEKAE